MQDVLGLSSNRVTLQPQGAGGEASLMGAQAKTYDVDEDDFFWEQAGG